MNLTQRMIAPLLVAAGLIAAAAPAAQAQDYPKGPIRFIVPVPAGGGVDLLARTIGAKMATSMGVPVVIENKAGASAAIGTADLAKAPGDGYTIMMAYSTHATNPVFNPNLAYDTDKDFTAVAFVGYIPLIMVTQPNSGIDSVRKLVDMARAKPGSIAYASGGAGAGAHLSGERFKYLAKVDLIHVPYKGNAPALNDVLGGQVPVMWDTITTALPHVKSGKLRALAVTSRKRSPLAPDVPTMIEAGLPDFEISAWYVVMAPKNLPPEVLRRLNAEVNKAIQDPEVRERLGNQGVDFVGGSAADAEKFIRNELERWARVARTTGMKGN
ncbi:MAG: tripartite tricarboxylate transporter substrate binding protein [Betaproteobacteria bacterium]